MTAASPRLLTPRPAHALLVLVGVLLALLAVAAPPARGQEPFTVTVTPETGLADTDTVSVDVTGIPPGQGIYLMYCIDLDGRATGDQCSGAQAWISPTGTPGSQRPDDGPFDLEVVATFGDHDCREVVCGVQTRRDHMGGDDTSLDTFTPVSFASGEVTEEPTDVPTDAPTEDPTDIPTDEPTPTPTPDPTAPVDEPTTAAFGVTVHPTTDLADQDTVMVEVTGLPRGQGVYVQLCAAQPGGTRATGAQCEDEGEYGGGVWVVDDFPYPGAAPDGAVDPADGPFPVQVTRTFNAVDCALVACGIQTRRDHRAGGDTSLDTFTPVTFASVASPATPPTAEVDGTDALPATGAGTSGLLPAALGMLVAGGALLRRRATT